MNLSCLFLHTQLGRSITKKLRQSLTTSMLPVLKSFIQRRLNEKSKDCRSALPNWKHFKPYNRIGIYRARLRNTSNALVVVVVVLFLFIFEISCINLQKMVSQTHMQHNASENWSKSFAYWGPLTCLLAYLLTYGWRLDVVVSVVGRINEVNQHRARLVSWWVTGCTGKPSLTNNLGQLSFASLLGR